MSTDGGNTNAASFESDSMDSGPHNSNYRSGQNRPGSYQRIRTVYSEGCQRLNPVRVTNNTTEGTHNVRPSGCFRGLLHSP